ncbi:MAG: hypothetical protein M3457_20750, partial [Chloroflexota bacterium]|nr:hypothetical protein [Chloroflexota bacterium]
MIIDSYEPGAVIDLTPIVPASPGITYRLSGIVAPNETITVTADLHEGYDWPDDPPRGWREVDDDTAIHTFMIDAELEIVVNPGAPVVEQASCDGRDPEVSLPGTVGVTYGRIGKEVAGGRVTISATLEPGYNWSGALPPGWSLAGNSSARYVVQLSHVTCDQGDSAVDPAPFSTRADPGMTTATSPPST